MKMKHGYWDMKIGIGYQQNFGKILKLLVYHSSIHFLPLLLPNQINVLCISVHWWITTHCFIKSLNIIFLWHEVKIKSRSFRFVLHFSLFSLDFMTSIPLRMRLPKNLCITTCQCYALIIAVPILSSFGHFYSSQQDGCGFLIYTRMLCMSHAFQLVFSLFITSTDISPSNTHLLHRQLHSLSWLLLSFSPNFCHLLLQPKLHLHLFDITYIILLVHVNLTSLISTFFGIPFFSPLLHSQFSFFIISTFHLLYNVIISIWLSL